MGLLFLLASFTFLYFAVDDVHIEIVYSKKRRTTGEERHSGVSLGCESNLVVKILLDICGNIFMFDDNSTTTFGLIYVWWRWLAEGV
jgi:hypothetical protein